MSSKHFSDVRLMVRDPILGPPDDFSFTMKGVTVSITVANCIRRVIGLDIPTFAISPETISYSKNTSVWDPEMIGHQLSFIPMKPSFLSKTDLNMLELMLDVRNEEKEYRYVFSKEFMMRNKETNKVIPVDQIFVYDNLPLFLLGPRQQVTLTCKLDYSTKRELGARHQSATAGIDYVTDDKDPDKDPDEILFNVNIQTGFTAKELVSVSFDNLIARTRKLQEAINKKDTNLFYIQLNRYHRYDFVFLGEDHTMGSLVEKWNNRHDTRSVTGYRQTRDRKAITIDYGLHKFSPVIFVQNNDGSDDRLENLIEKSIVSLDEKKEKEQRDSTIRIFVENLTRLEKYLLELKTDWNKVKVVDVSTKDFMETVEKQRVERSERD
jgi:hypothetical protein